MSRTYRKNSEFNSKKDRRQERERKSRIRNEDSAATVHMDSIDRRKYFRDSADDERW